MRFEVGDFALLESKRSTALDPFGVCRQLVDQYRNDATGSLVRHAIVRIRWSSTIPTKGRGDYPLHEYSTTDPRLSNITRLTIEEMLTHRSLTVRLIGQYLVENPGSNIGDIPAPTPPFFDTMSAVR